MTTTNTVALIVFFLAGVGAAQVLVDISKLFKLIGKIADNRANDKICMAIFHYEYYVCKRDIRSAIIYASDITFGGTPIPNHLPNVSSGCTNGVS